MIGLIAYAAIVLGLLTALWKYPPVALAGVLCMFGLEQWGQATTPFFVQHHTATNLVIGSLLVLAVIVQFTKCGLAMFAGYPSTGWLTIMLFLFAFLSTQWAPRMDLSLKLWDGAWPYIITFIVLSPLVIVTNDDLRSANKALILIGSILVPLLLLAVPWEGRQIVLGREAGNPLAISALGGMVVMVLLLADPWKGKNLWLPVKWILVALCLTLIVRSGSRGQLFSMLIVLLLCWPLANGFRHPRQMIGLAFLVLFIGGITSWALETFWSEKTSYYAGGSRWSGEAVEGAMEGRFESALFLVERCYESVYSIVFGLGNSAAFDPRLLGVYPHFVPLEVLAEEGLVGFVLYAAILIGTLRNVYQSYRILDDTHNERSLFAALVAVFLFTGLLSFKQGSLLGNLEPFMFAILLGKYRYSLWQFRVSDGQNTREEGSVNCTMTTYSEVSCLRT